MPPNHPRTPTTPAHQHHHQNGRPQPQNNNNGSPAFNQSATSDSFHLSPRSPMSAKLNIDPKNPGCLQLCLDVPFLDHPYLIGPRGRKSQYFMTRYKSLLHFPDTNCRSDGLKLNNVLISGTMKNVEEIRGQIRLRTPIRVVVQLNLFPNGKQIAQEMEEAIAQRSLPIRFNLADDMRSGVLKTEWRNEDLLVEFCEEHLKPKQPLKSRDDLYTIGIALLPLVNPWNQELSHRLIGNIHEQTGCRIFYPPKDKYSVQPPTYFVKGSSMHGLLKATKYLMGLTMLQVTFYLPPGVQPHVMQNQLDDWQRDLLVHTTIYNPEMMHIGGSPQLPQFKVVLRSFEFSINGLYFVRSALLGFKRSVETNSYDFMKTTKFLIPYTVFNDAKLFFPLYSVDDKNLNFASNDFYQNFYGGPYSTPPHPQHGHVGKSPRTPRHHHQHFHHFPPVHHHQQHHNQHHAQQNEESELEQQQPVVAPAEKSAAEIVSTPTSSKVPSAGKQNKSKQEQPQQLLHLNDMPNPYTSPDHLRYVHLQNVVHVPPQQNGSVTTPHYVFLHAMDAFDPTGMGSPVQQPHGQHVQVPVDPMSLPFPQHDQGWTQSRADPLALLNW